MPPIAVAPIWSWLNRSMACWVIAAIKFTASVWVHFAFLAALTRMATTDPAVLSPDELFVYFYGIGLFFSEIAQLMHHYHPLPEHRQIIQLHSIAKKLDAGGLDQLYQLHQHLWHFANKLVKRSPVGPDDAQSDDAQSDDGQGPGKVQYAVTLVESALYSYFSSVWNCLDVVIIVFTFVCAFQRLLGTIVTFFSSGDEALLPQLGLSLSILAIAGWLRVFGFTSMFRQIGPLISTVLNVQYDVILFALFCVSIVLGFGTAMVPLFITHEDFIVGEAGDMEPSGFVFTAANCSGYDDGSRVNCSATVVHPGDTSTCVHCRLNDEGSGCYYGELRGLSAHALQSGTGCRLGHDGRTCVGCVFSPAKCIDPALNGPAPATVARTQQLCEMRRVFSGMNSMSGVFRQLGLAIFGLQDMEQISRSWQSEVTFMVYLAVAQLLLLNLLIAMFNNTYTTQLEHKKQEWFLKRAQTVHESAHSIESVWVLPLFNALYPLWCALKALLRNRHRMRQLLAGCRRPGLCSTFKACWHRVVSSYALLAWLFLPTADWRVRIANERKAKEEATQVVVNDEADEAELHRRWLREHREPTQEQEALCEMRHYVNDKLEDLSVRIIQATQASAMPHGDNAR
jgi:hypothetical protein